MNLVNETIKAGFADYGPKTAYCKPFVPAPFKRPSIAKNILTVWNYPVTKLEKPPDPTQDTYAQLYQEDARIARVTPSPYRGLYELARFYAPWGSIGVVRQAWQWLELKDPPATPKVLGTPFDAMYHTRSTPPGTVDILWKLRLIVGQVKGSYVNQPQNTLPFGQGYPRFANWSELRFPWGSNAPVFWLVPENMTLCMYADIRVGDLYIESIGARLAGYIQTISKESQYNTRHGFTW